MQKTNSKKHTLILLILNLILGLNSFDIKAQDSLKLVTPDDYEKWESINNYALSNDGNWLKYQINTQGGDQTTYLYNIKSGKLDTIINAAKSSFSEKSIWFSYDIVPSGKEAKRINKNKDKKPRKTVLLNLKSMDTINLEDYSYFNISGTENFIALVKENNNTKTLIVKNLETSSNLTFGNITEFRWQPEGDLLAMLIKTEDNIGNTIQLYNPNTGTLKVLDQKDVEYSGLNWFEKSNTLFVRRKVENKDYENNTFDLLAWNNIGKKNTSSFVFNQNDFENFPIETRILPDRISISDDGNHIFFKTFSWNKKVSEENKEKDSTATDTDKIESPDLEIWNSRDVVIIPAQKRSRMKDIETPKNAVWHLKENKIVQLNDSLVDDVKIQQNNEVMIGLDGTPYDFEAMFGRPSYDAYVINSLTGAKTKVLENIFDTWDVSPNNTFFVYLKNNHLHLFDINSKTTSNITKNIDATFINFEDDHPLPQKRAFGFGGWSKDSKSFFIYSEFDVWQVFTKTGNIRKITNGKDENIVYRIVSLDRDEPLIDTDELIYFSLFGKYSKQTGYASGIPGKGIKRHIFEDASITRLMKAKNANDMIFVKQSYVQSPNVYLTNSTFSNPLQISNTNPFQKNYNWGKAKLVSFTNALGKEAQGILYYPADYKEGEKYPMITYIYEKLTRGLNRYIMPSKTDYYNTTVWTQNGYFVLNPDIDFIAGNPGVSSTKTLENAVSAVVDLGDVDPSKVGLIGHSWGGYQAGYVPTQTNIFAASVAGAGLTDLISMNLAITPAFGGRPENDHFEVGQERMDTAPWVSPENYIKNSSVMQIEKLNTPILFEVGDNDLNVNWAQGIEYYNAARRANKPFILLVYAKEGHGLRADKNRIDYQQRILKWFGHYLKGEVAEDWITKGIPYAEQQRRLKN
ncbi:alpha/beta hydrolase family protein [Aestuariivivens marinum]|uniref:alpha/beta hydrolase family protein n=1 Tax=Aestuariivivens marinum TaxID=2913555 RepID=UPI001F55ADE6|nr:prolyl oligopeptidase family serine peptidase [Aestuariivivens marinum]